MGVRLTHRHRPGWQGNNVIEWYNALPMADAALMAAADERVRKSIGGMSAWPSVASSCPGLLTFGSG
jgi:hypothetical protein